MIIELDKNVNGTACVRNHVFSFIEASKHGFIYRNDTYGHYEVFERKITPLLINFEKREYSETDFKVRFPKKKDFGIWAFTYHSLDKAKEKLKSFENLII